MPRGEKVPTVQVEYSREEETFKPGTEGPGGTWQVEEGNIYY